MIVATWLSRKARERFLLSRRGDQAFAVIVAWVGGRASASLAFKGRATAIAFDIHLEDAPTTGGLRSNHGRAFASTATASCQS
jgi:hypothetical protein